MNVAPYWQDDVSALFVGDASDVLAAMPDGSADCIVTSPPYWGKRDYGIAGQYGQESTPDAYIATLRDTFTQARRVLADDGTCWLNLGDSYTVSGGAATGMHAYASGHLTARKTPGMRAKNLLGIPWRVALALQEDGWIIRNAVVWHKPNAMPESVRDRLNCRHELIFLLVKQPAYWFDLDPIRIPSAKAGHAHPARTARHPGSCRPPSRPRMPTRPPKYGPHAREVTSARRFGGLRTGHRRTHPRGRNPGDVWAIPTRPYAGPHFAAYPIDLPLRCIAAGCKPGGTVLDPFAGTGTTGLAARQLGRRFAGIELLPRFAALAAERLSQTTRKPQDGQQ